jgi:signal transduction histidine kinase
MAGLQAGQLRLAHEAFDVWETANQVATEMRPLALDKGLKFDVQLAADLGYARGDAARVAQVLRELLHNAIRFSECGRVSLHAGLQQDGQLRFQVVDSGIGMASEDQAGLFEAFHHIDNPLAQAHTGSGLGLAICRRLARLMGGDLVLDSSQPQHGSSFSFSLVADDLGQQRPDS